MRINIGTKLIASFMVVVLLMVALALYLVNRSQKSLQECVGKNSIFLADEMLKRMDHGIYLKIERLQALSQGALLQRTVLESNQGFEKLDNIPEYISKKDKNWTSAPKEEMTPFMQELISNALSNSLRRQFIEFYEERYGYRIFGEVFVTNKYGANIAQTEKTSDYRQDDEEWWQIARERGFYVSDVEYDESAGIYAISIGVRVDDEKGNFMGVIKAVADVTGLMTEAVIATKKYETTEIKLITKDGRLVYATKAFRFLEDVSKKELFKKIKGESGFLVAKEGGRERLFSHAHSKGYRNFEGLQWILVLRHDVEEILKPVFILRNSTVVASLVLITMSILIAFFISRSICKPVTRLRDATIEIAKGNLDTQVEVKSNDEIGQLATSFKKMTEDLHRTTVSRDYVDNIIKSMIGTVIVATPEARIKTVNQAALDLLGYTEDELLSQPVGIIFTEGRTGLEDLIKKGFISDVEKTYLAKDGRKIPMLFSGSVMRDDDRIQGIVCVALDITERKRAEEAIKKYAGEIEQANIRLKELDRLKSMFIASMSHELRTPLNSIIGFTGIILQGMTGELNEEQKKQLTMVKNSASHLLALINDVIDVSKIEAGKVDLLIEEFDLSALVKEVESSFRVSAEEKHLKMSLDMPTRLTIKSDERRTKQVLMNLVGNAVKFTDRGEIEIKVAKKDERVEVSLRDTGMGIRKENMDRLFKAFTQIPSEGRPKQEGTGLGLYLSKKILNLLGGEMKAESEFGKGSVFVFTLPLKYEGAKG